MKSIFDKSASQQLNKRIDLLSADSKGLWGKMTSNQMLCHLSDPLRDIMGIRQAQPLLPAQMQQQLKAFVLSDLEWEHNLQTFAPYSQDEEGRGTKPTSFEQDKKTLADLLNQLFHTPVDFSFHPHAGLNILTRQEFGIFIWKHTDYHLRQFGV